MGAAMMGVGAAMQLAGDIMGGIQANKRKKAINEITNQFQPIDLQSEASRAILGNFANMPDAEKLTSAVNTYVQQERMRNLEEAMPEYKGLRKEQLDLIESINDPKQLLADSQLDAAKFRITSGTGESGFGDAYMARQFGLKRREAALQKLSALDRWIDAGVKYQKAGEFDLTSMFVTPMQMYQTRTEQDQIKYDRLLNAWGVPTSGEYWSKTLQSRGGQMMGMGVDMMDSGSKKKKSGDFDLESVGQIQDYGNMVV